MCGIIGTVGSDEAVNILIDGLTILESRGYDSAGISTIDETGQLHTNKCASLVGTTDAIKRLREKLGEHAGHRIGIGHTRWATHGGKTDANAHPHHDEKNRIALVHNGVIENANTLRNELKKKGIAFRSETDTEVIAQLIGSYLNDGELLLDATKHAIARLEGTWGIAIISSLAPGSIIAARNGSPLVVGIGNGKMFIASEPAAFSSSTREFIALQNGEVAVIRADGTTLDISRVERASDETIALSPAPYPHWTLKEIMEQPDAVSRTLNYGARILDDTHVKLGGLESDKERLLAINHLVIAACGTSYHAALYGALALRALQSFTTVQVVDASELTPHHFPSEGAGLLVLSQSGETKDVHRALAMAEEHNVPTFSIVNAVGSLIARQTRCGVYLNAGREHAVASTKAFVTQVTALELVAVWFAQYRETEVERRRKIIDELRRLPTLLRQTLATREACRAVVNLLLKADHCFLLGKGPCEAIAREGALKIKELTYIHAEGYPGGALKHGPFALIGSGTPVILILLDDQHAQFMRTAAEEVRARGATTVVITDNAKLADGIADHTIVIPNAGVLSALLATVPLQYIAYDVAVQKGINPDRPRNLAKAVTVD